MSRDRVTSVGIVLSLVGLGVGAASSSVGQSEREGTRVQPTVQRAVRFAVSPPVRDLVAAATAPVQPGEDREAPLRALPSREKADLPVGPDGALQVEAPTGEMPIPLVNFDGLSNQDNSAVHGFQVYPPDTNGDVGPNHYVQMVNLVVRIYNKTGTPLTPPFKLSNLFASLGGPCAAVDDGDPIVLYDPLADRWLLSQFCLEFTPNPHQMIAISQTGDPTGAYYVYDFPMPNNKINDYPKFGVWPDAYYMTDNQFRSFFEGVGVFAFDRSKMLVGDPTASYLYFDLGVLLPRAAGMLPADLDGLTPPPAGAPNVMAFFVANEFGDPADAIRLFDFHADFATPSASTFTERAGSPLPVAAFDPRSPSGRSDIEQPAPGVPVDSISDRLMHRLAYRNFGSHESLVVTHTVNVGTGTTIDTHQAAIRYYELRRTSASGAFSVNEQATFAPDTDNRWMGSAAQDAQGNLAVGYSVSSSTTYPTIRYAGRLATDPPGGLFQGEATLVAGSGVQRGTASRWGDYSALSVDPVDDCTFWYTTEYYTAASQASSSIGWVTRIGSFRFPGCVTGPNGTLEGTVTSATTGLPIAGAQVQAANTFLTTTDASGHYSLVLPVGTYDVTVTAPSFKPGGASGVEVTDGGTTSADFALDPRVPTQISIQAGNNQTAVVGTAVPVPPSVIVRDEDDEPVAGVSVTFAVASGGGAVLGPATLVTNTSGIATVGGWRLGPSPGPNTLTATPEVPLASSPVTFDATGVELTVSVNDVALVEGNGGTRNAVFTLGLSMPVPAGQSASVSVSTQDGTATGGGMTNQAPILIPVSAGNAMPYPSSITVPPSSGMVGRVTVTLHSFSHTFPRDVDILLVGPAARPSS